MQNSLSSCKKPRTQIDENRAKKGYNLNESPDSNKNFDTDNTEDHIQYSNGMHFMAMFEQNCSNAESKNSAETESQPISEHFIHDALLKRGVSPVFIN